VELVVINVEELSKSNRFKKNHKYMIRKSNTKKELIFEGFFLQAYDYHYLFMAEKGLRECFLKIDFEIKEYVAEEIFRSD
jgi:hypothetical protein